MSHGTVVQVILSSMLPICDCNAMDEAAAAFSSNSGDRTLEYNMICQWKNDHLVAVLSHHWRLQYNDMHTDHIESNHDSDVFLMRLCIQCLLQVKFAVYDENFELPGMVIALSYAYIWKFHYILDREDLIVWNLNSIEHSLDHCILVSYKISTLANLQTQGVHQ